LVAHEKRIHSIEQNAAGKQRNKRKARHQKESGRSHRNLALIIINIATSIYIHTFMCVCI